jgi:branched-chain amino acid transport system substrate-binding protein
VSLESSPRARIVVALACALALCAAGCGGAGAAEEQPVRGTRLIVYASAPLSGPDRAVGIDVMRAQRLALAHHGGRIGRYRVHLVALDAARPAGEDANARQLADPRRVSENARRAASDLRAIAYIGELRSGASAISIPILNAAGMLGVSPLDTALGLTTRSAAITGSPERYYPNVERAGRTFARLVPSDRVQAAVQLRAMADAGVRRIALLTDEDAPGLALASAIRGAARAHGVAVVGVEAVDWHAQEHADLVRRVLAARPDAALYAGGVRDAAVRVLRELALAAPGVRLYVPDAIADGTLLGRLGPAERSTYVTRPLLTVEQYGPAARRFSRAFVERFGARPLPEALYGYEAMRVVLRAIEDAERAAADGALVRGDVVRAFFAGARRDGVLGPYRIDANGDTSLRRWGLYQVVGGRLRFERALDG